MNSATSPNERATTLLIGSKHLAGAVPAPSNEIGGKARSLVDTPLNWTLPFAVIPCSLLARLASPLTDDDQVSDLTLQELDRLLPLLNKGHSEAIVRSSAISEGLDLRGRFDSHVCPTNSELILAKAIEIWNQAQFLSISGVPTELAAIVQPYARPMISGHLSNERRLSKRKTDWLCEFNSSVGTEQHASRFAIRSNAPFNPDLPLNCTDLSSLNERLKELAAFCQSRSQRQHIEWVWDGSMVWLVQLDEEEEIQTLRTPTAPWPQPDLREFRPKFKVLRSVNKAAGRWRKIECVRTFAGSRLPTPRVYVLEDVLSIAALLTGQISEELKQDLTKICRFPVVIRTDKAAAPSKTANTLLPRTNIVPNTTSAIQFLTATAKRLASEGLSARDFCFIFHNFIKGTSSAFAYARPGFPRVRVDGTYGLPDGLLFYPHDSYEVSTANSDIKKKLRAKQLILQEAENGEWLATSIGAPWDWKQSITDEDLREIGRQALTIAKKLNSPVEIMFFCGVDPKSGYEAVLPWYYELADEKKTDQDRTQHFRLGGRRFVVSMRSSLEALREIIRNSGPRDRVLIVIRPSAEFLRNRDFIVEVGEFANANNLPIELEGSVLQHAYYLLKDTGAKVRCVDAFSEVADETRFGKLVRDLVPARIARNAEYAEIFRANRTQMLYLLKAKVIEEAYEVFTASGEEALNEELADLLEVIRAIQAARGKEVSQLFRVADKKRAQRGDFSSGLVLLRTRQVPLVPSNEGSTFTDVLQFAEKDRIVFSSPLFDPSRQNQPQRFGREIRVPLIPPAEKYDGLSFRISLDEDRTVLIRYRPTFISVEVRTASPELDENDPRQLKLDFE